MTTIKMREFGKLLKRETIVFPSNWLMHSTFFGGALLFSQAVILDAVAPFFLAFWLIVQQRYKSYQLATVLGGIIGSSYLAFGQALAVLCVIVLVEILIKLRFFEVRPLSSLLTAIFIVQVIWQAIFYSGIPPFLVQVYVIYELFFVALAFLFMKQFFLTHHDFLTKWTAERVIAGCVVLALLIIGMQEMVVFYFSMPILSLQLAICLAAVVGGLPASLFVAVVVGMLSGIAQLSFTGMLALYALTGVTVGLMQRAGQLAVVISSIAPSVFFFLYDATLPLDSVYFVSIISAGVVMLCLPKDIVQQMQGLYVAQTSTKEVAATSTTENHLLPFQQFVYFLKDLVTEQFMLTTPAMSKTSPLSVCAGCFRYEHCWKNGAIKEPVEQWIAAKTLHKPFDVLRVEEQLKGKCVKPQKLLEEMNDEIYVMQMNNRFYHGKKMLALQLCDLSEHLERLLENQQAIEREKIDEEALTDFLDAHTIICIYACWKNNALGECVLICHVVGNYSIDLLQQMSELLTEFFDEPLVGKDMTHHKSPYPYTELHFHSAIRYKLAYDVYKRAERTSVVSGDSHSIFSLQPGLEVVMLSDGMGTNYRAQRESERLIQMMKSCLSYDMNPETAMHTVHYILSLKNESDLYATLDFALVDLKRGELWWWKAGGMTTYILRGSEVITLESNTAPIGFFKNVSIETMHQHLQENDYIIMVSDGVFSANEDWKKQERTFLQFLRHSIKKHSDLSMVLYEAMTQYEERFFIEDDCTVMLFSVKQLKKEWFVYKPEQLKRGG